MAVFVTSQLCKNTSELDIDSSTRIISFSDIHGDMDALIIALRDCAKVIRPTRNIPAPGNNIRDPELNTLLKLNLLDLQQHQEFDANAHLNFEWIGGTTHVVIVGDILDPIRNIKYAEYNNIYPQVEIKILKFLNKLDEMAQQYFGRVIKLIGNHEFNNFDYDGVYAHYTFNPQELMPYIDTSGNIQTHPRYEYFNLNKPGFKLYMERGSGIFLRINNTLFMHGQVYDRNFSSFTFNKCNEFNKWINKSSFLNINDPIFTDFKETKGSAQLWARKYGNDDEIDTRLRDPTLGDQFCAAVTQDITSFLQDHPNNADPKKKLNPDNIRIVIGHCPQYQSTAFPNKQTLPEFNRTFTTQRQIDDISVELTEPAKSFAANAANIDANKVFGISMECPNKPHEPDGPHHKVYKVDVGVSRAFDQTKTNKRAAQGHIGMKTWFLSRVPQVLEFLGDNVRIIRSTLKNTRIHQERKKFEELINHHVNVTKTLPDDMSRENMTYGGYKEKYLKYKNKYLNLKNHIG
jgi:hypothetical protein